MKKHVKRTQKGLTLSGMLCRFINPDQIAERNRIYDIIVVERADIKFIVKVGDQNGIA